MGIKTYILDTNVMLHDPESLFSFEENEVVIPFPVIKELEKHKSGQLDINYAARHALNVLDSPPKTIKPILYDKLEELKGITSIDMDTIILKYVATFIHHNPKKEVILVTKDTTMRIIAKLVGIKCEDYESDKSYDFYKGHRKGNINQNLLRDLLQGSVDYTDAYIEGLNLNEYIQYPNDTIGKFKGEKIEFVKNQIISGIIPKNSEQIMAANALMDKNISLVTLTGKSGSGKTLLSLAAALSQNYEKIIVSKPTIPISKDLEIGFLPGNMKEKLEHWFLPFQDNIEFLASLKRSKHTKEELNEKVSYFSLGHIRGRSIPNQFIICDEAQNTTPHMVKSLISRIGEGSKIVLIGDLNQIDHPFISKESCGLNHVINRFKGQDIFAQIHLEKGERSKLATLASDLL